MSSGLGEGSIHFPVEMTITIKIKLKSTEFRIRSWSYATCLTIRNIRRWWVPAAPYRCPCALYPAIQLCCATYPSIPTTRITWASWDSTRRRAAIFRDIRNCCATSATIRTSRAWPQRPPPNPTATCPVIRSPTSPECTCPEPDRLFRCASRALPIRDCRLRPKNSTTSWPLSVDPWYTLSLIFSSP